MKKCERCGGKMVAESIFVELEGKWAKGRRCVMCGHYSDPVVRRNQKRKPGRHERRGEGAKPLKFLVGRRRKEER